MTDPTPQAVTCLHCGKTVSEGIERDCYGSKTGMHNWVEPADPSPAPQAQIERPKREQVLTLGGLVRVMYDASEMDDYLDDRDRLQSDLAAMGTDLGVMVEERDRVQDALSVYQMAFHDACVDAHPEDEGFQAYKLQSLRNAEAEMKMLNVVVPLFIKEMGLDQPVPDRQPEGVK